MKMDLLKGNFVCEHNIVLAANLCKRLVLKEKFIYDSP